MRTSNGLDDWLGEQKTERAEECCTEDVDEGTVAGVVLRIERLGVTLFIELCSSFLQKCRSISFWKGSVLGRTRKQGLNEMAAHRSHSQH